MTGSRQTIKLMCRRDRHDNKMIVTNNNLSKRWKVEVSVGGVGYVVGW